MSMAATAALCTRGRRWPDAAVRVELRLPRARRALAPNDIRQVHQPRTRALRSANQLATMTARRPNAAIAIRDRARGGGARAGRSGGDGLMARPPTDVGTSGCTPVA